MPLSPERPIESDYLYLSNSDETGNSFAHNVSRLVPKLSVPYDAQTYTARYLRPNGNENFIVSAFIIDRDMTTPAVDRPRFMLGFTASLLDALEEGEAPGVSAAREIESISIEGSLLDLWVARRLDVKPRVASDKYPLRLQSKVGERVVTVTGDPAFPDIVAARSLVNSFYIRHGILSLGPDMQWRPEHSRPNNEQPAATIETAVPSDEEHLHIDDTHNSDTEVPDVEVDLADEIAWDESMEYVTPPDEKEYPPEDLDEERILDTPTVEYTDADAPDLDEPERMPSVSYYDDDFSRWSSHSSDDSMAHYRDRMA